MYKLRVFSPNKSCAPLRDLLLSKRVLLRLGSTTPLVSRFKYIELNSIEGVRISANKILMKTAFDKANINHSEWICSKNINIIKDFVKTHKIVIAKHYHSSKGEGIYYIDSNNILDEFLQNHPDIHNYVFEKYYFFPNEYRLHVDVKHGCFYACKKVLLEEANIEWHKHANNSKFVLVRNEDNIPDCWKDIIIACQKAMIEMSLNIACFDILCCNNDFIIVESNTAPSLADFGITYYSNHIQKYYGRF